MQLNDCSEKQKDTRYNICCSKQMRKSFRIKMESYSLGMSYKLRVSKSITFGDQGATDISARKFSQTGGVIKHNAEF